MRRRPNIKCKPHEVLIVITPMEYFDEMRAQRHRAQGQTAGDVAGRKSTLNASGVWSRDMIRELIQQKDGG